MKAIEEELIAHPGDRRTALLPLFDHPNAQVRLKAALAKLAVLPDEARETLEILDENKEFPQAADARGMLEALDDGSYQPS